MAPLPSYEITVEVLDDVGALEATHTLLVHDQPVRGALLQLVEDGRWYVVVEEKLVPNHAAALDARLVMHACIVVRPHGRPPGASPKPTARRTRQHSTAPTLFPPTLFPLSLL